LPSRLASLLSKCRPAIGKVGNVGTLFFTFHVHNKFFKKLFF
jgi:hypothetical protein